MQLDLKLSGGITAGPLFAPGAKLRQPKPRMCGTIRWAALRKHTPAWADKAEIRKVYLEARRLTATTGVQYSVDHIVPINGGTVCGLHVAHNLRIIPLVYNMAKSANTWPDMPGESEDLWPDGLTGV